MLLPGREPPRLKAGELAGVDSLVCRGEARGHELSSAATLELQEDA
jgi:hypothetical protein